MKAILDKMLGKVISKKLTVFLIATVFLWFGHITSEQWVNLSIVYVGTQGTLDIFLALKNKK